MTTEKPTLRDQLAAALPDHTTWRADIFETTARWTTPAGLWQAAIRPLSGIHITGPKGALGRLTIDQAIGTLRVLGAIAEPEWEPEQDDTLGPILNGIDPTYDADQHALTVATYAVAHVLTEGTTVVDGYLHVSADQHNTARYAAQTALTNVHLGNDVVHIAATGEQPDPSRPIRRVTDAEAQQHIAAVTGEPSEAPLCGALSPAGNTCTEPAGHPPVEAYGVLWGHAITQDNSFWNGNHKTKTADTVQEPARA